MGPEPTGEPFNLYPNFWWLRRQDFSFPLRDACPGRICRLNVYPFDSCVLAQSTEKEMIIEDVDEEIERKRMLLCTPPEFELEGMPAG